MTFPDLSNEIELWKKGFTVIGIDEVGRGAFAGPVFAAGVIFPPTNDEDRIANLLSYGINDSKKLSAKKRELLSKIIQKEALAYHISQIDVDKINDEGIGEATFCAMREVVRSLDLSLNPYPNPLLMGKGEIRKADIFVLVDGFNIKNLVNIEQRGIIRGDGISLSIAAASIIAKVARDEYMTNLSPSYPEFDWAQNKGYGTLFHRQVLQKVGATPLHRVDFVENFV